MNFIQEHINEIDEKLQLKIIKEESDIFLLIAHPSKKIIEDSILNILDKDINSDDILYEDKIDFIQEHIDNLSEKLQLKVIEKYPELLSYITNPSKSFTEKIVFNYLSVNDENHNDIVLDFIQEHINEISNDLQLKIVNKDHYFIYNIENPTKVIIESSIEKILKEDISINSYKFNFIEKNINFLSEDMQILLLKKYPILINYITNISRKVSDSIKVNPIVSNFTINPNADNYLYYFMFYFKNKKYYKIGVTSRSLKERYSNEYHKINKILFYKKIDGALKIEKKILQDYKKHLFPLAYFSSGHTEVFDIDVLGLDTKDI